MIPLALVAFIYWVFKRRGTNDAIKAGFLFFIVTIFPVLQIIPNTFTIASDRYHYISSLGLFTIIMVYFLKFYERKDLKAVTTSVFCIVLILFSVQAYKRCTVWKNSITLFTDVVNKHKDVAIAYANLGLAYNEKGDFRAALPVLEKALALRGNYPETHNNYGWALSMTGQLEKSVLHFTRATELNPLLAPGYINLANSYGRLGKFEQAIENFEKALDLEPENASILYNLAFTYLKMKEDQKALEYYQKAARMGHKPAQQFLIKNRLSW